MAGGALSADLAGRCASWLRHRHAQIVLAAISLFALALRFYGIDFCLPKLCHADEPGYVALAQQLFKSGNWNPGFFNYPSLFFYLNAIAYVPFYLVGWLTGHFHSLADIQTPQWVVMGVGTTAQPTTIILARGTTALFASATVPLTFAIARRVAGGNTAGLIAAALLAVSPAAVRESRFVAPDAFCAFFAALAVLCALRAHDSGKLIAYAAAGVCVGLTASVKYNGVVVAVAVAASAILALGGSRKTLAALAVSGFAACVGFLLTSPFVLLDYAQFSKDFAFEARHYSTRHSGVTGSSLLFYTDLLLRREGVASLLALAGLAFAVLTRERRLLILCSFPVAYFLVIVRFPVHNERTLLPLIPALLAIAAVVVNQVHARLIEWRPWAIPRLGLVSLTVAALVLFPLRRAVAETRQLVAERAAEVAAVWIEQNLPPGASIIVEGYGPYVDPKRFDVEGTGYLTYKPARYYRNRFDYVVFSSGAFARFFENPAVFRRQVKGYRALFRALRHVKTFETEGETIRLFATDRASPSSSRPGEEPQGARAAE